MKTCFFSLNQSPTFMLSPDCLFVCLFNFLNSGSLWLVGFKKQAWLMKKRLLSCSVMCSGLCSHSKWLKNILKINTLWFGMGFFFFLSSSVLLKNQTQDQWGSLINCRAETGERFQKPFKSKSCSNSHSLEASESLFEETFTFFKSKETWA